MCDDHVYVTSCMYTLSSSLLSFLTEFGLRNILFMYLKIESPFTKHLTTGLRLRRVHSLGGGGFEPWTIHYCLVCYNLLVSFGLRKILFVNRKSNPQRKTFY